MAKPLGPKSLLIRDAIKAHPKLSPKELAEKINASPARKEDRIEVKPGEISQQKQMMKKAAEKEDEATPAASAPAAAKAPKRRGRRPAAPAAARFTAPTPAATASPVDLIDQALELARQCGGVEQLKRLVDRLAEMQRL